jgi:hypothetical protein
MPHRLYLQVAERADYRCEYCKAPGRLSETEYEVEHVWPQKRGGEDELPNLALACPSCNKKKGIAVYLKDVESGLSVPIFNPRRDVWIEHFEFDPETISIIGRTPTGRATVRRLAMNRPHVLYARAVWCCMDGFPRRDFT